MRRIIGTVIAGLVIVAGLFVWEAFGVKKLAIKLGRKLGTREETST